MADGVAITAGSGTTIATDDCGAPGHAQVVKLAISTDGSATLVPADSTNGLDVDVTRVPTDPFGANADAASATGSISAKLRFIASTGIPVTGTVTVGSHAVTNAGTFAVQAAGDVAHDTADSGAPVKVGMRAIAHGTNPTAVAAADRTDWLANRAGIPWVIGGHPNVVTVRATYAASAQTDTALVTVSSGTKIVVTAVSVAVSNSTTNTPLVRIGFATTNTPTTTGVLFSHPGIPGGGMPSRGDGSGILGVGGDGEDVRITSDSATSGTIDVVLTYYTIES